MLTFHWFFPCYNQNRQNLALLIHHPLTIFTTIVHPSPCSSPFFLHICGGGMLIEPYFHSCHNINRFIQAPFHFIIHMRVVIVNSYDIDYYIMRMILYVHDCITTFRKCIIIKLYRTNCSAIRDTRRFLENNVFLEISKRVSSTITKRIFTQWEKVI